MKLKPLMLCAAAILGAATFQSCELDPYIITSEEEYTRSFIKTFGLIDVNQDWNTAKEATVTLNLGNESMHTAKVYVFNVDAYYLVADLKDLCGVIKVPVDIPEDSEKMAVIFDGGDPVYGAPGDTFSPNSARSRSVGVTNGENTVYYTDYASTFTIGEKTVTIKAEDTNQFFVFNSMQMGPILSDNASGWLDYYSIAKDKVFTNTDNAKAYLPESNVMGAKGVRLAADASYLDRPELHADFTFNSTIPEGETEFTFYLYPMYWQTSNQHTLGIYIKDPDTQKLYKCPIYTDKDVRSLTQWKQAAATDQWTHSTGGTGSATSEDLPSSGGSEGEGGAEGGGDSDSYVPEPTEASMGIAPINASGASNYVYYRNANDITDEVLKAEAKAYYDSKGTDTEEAHRQSFVNAILTYFWSKPLSLGGYDYARIDDGGTLQWDCGSDISAKVINVYSIDELYNNGYWKVGLQVQEILTSDDNRHLSKDSAPRRVASRAADESIKEIYEEAKNYIDDDSRWGKPIAHNYNSNCAYDYDSPELIRSRAIKVTITGYEGIFGMYIDFDNGPNGGPLYSETYLNDDAKAGGLTNSDGEPAKTFAVTVVHPHTGRLLFSFEDWVNSGSDGDLNDIVFMTSNISTVNVGDEEIEVPDEITDPDPDPDPDPEYKFIDTPISWLICAEDLGATDDFDFNDVIFKISNITTNKYNAEDIDASGNPKDGATPIEGATTKRVTVKAMAAGGTLPVYLHYYDGAKDWVLGRNASGEGVAVEKALAGSTFEWHKWFGASMPSTTMINTGRATVTETLEVVLSNFVSMDKFSVANYSSKDGSKVSGFYITVNGLDGSLASIGGTVTNSDSDEETKVIGAPGKGEAPQMFLITDNGWRWPIERVRIFNAYSGFSTWVSGGCGIEWTSFGSESNTIRPLD